MRITMRVVYIVLHVYMAHLNKLNKSLQSKRLPCSGDVIYFQQRRTCSLPTSQCKLRRSRANSRLYKWAEHGDLFTLQITPGRAPSIRAEPSPLGGPGPHDIWVGRARSDAFTLHLTGLGTVPSAVKLYSVNGAIASKKDRNVHFCKKSPKLAQMTFDRYLSNHDIGRTFWGGLTPSNQHKSNMATGHIGMVV